MVNSRGSKLSLGGSMLMKTKVDNLINYIKSFCLDHYIKCTLIPEKFIMGDGVPIGGCFGQNDAGEYELKCACGLPSTKFVPLLIHEFCHLKQYLEDPKSFDRSSYALGRVFEFIDSKHRYENLDKDIYTCLLVELDCEHRAVEMIQNFGLEKLIPIDVYCRKANAYIISYWNIFLTGEWYKEGRSPYRVKECWSKFKAKLGKPHEYHYHEVQPYLKYFDVL